jgi:hypothetical protein
MTILEILVLLVLSIAFAILFMYVKAKALDPGLWVDCMIAAFWVLSGFWTVMLFTVLTQCAAIVLILQFFGFTPF